MIQENPLISIGVHVTPALIEALARVYPDRCLDAETAKTPAGVEYAYAVAFIRWLDEARKQGEKQALLGRR